MFLTLQSNQFYELPLTKDRICCNYGNFYPVMELNYRTLFALMLLTLLTMMIDEGRKYLQRK